MIGPYSAATIGAEESKIDRTDHEILQDVDSLVRTLRTEMISERQRLDQKIRWAVIGALATGTLAFFLPDSYQDSVEAAVTYASFGFALGVLLG